MHYFGRRRSRTQPPPSLAIFRLCDQSTTSMTASIARGYPANPLSPKIEINLKRLETPWVVNWRKSTIRFQVSPRNISSEPFDYGGIGILRCWALRKCIPLRLSSDKTYWWGVDVGVSRSINLRRWLVITSKNICEGSCTMQVGDHESIYSYASMGVARSDQVKWTVKKLTPRW